MTQSRIFKCSLILLELINHLVLTVLISISISLEDAPTVMAKSAEHASQLTEHIEK
jgi:hypothetical protein